jgi:Tol biopolymer transport system component
MLAFLVNPDNADRGSVPSHNDLWITPVAGAGRAAGKLAKIALPTWAYRIAGWVGNDRIGLLQSSPLHGAVYTVPLSGGKATQVTHDSEAVPTSPQWSPDGQRIYVRWMMGDVAFVPAGGGKVTVVAQSGERVTESMPVGGNHVSPDGKHIVFAGARSGGAAFTVHLWTMPVTGGEPVQLTKNLDRHAFQPRWSPDGKWIVFHAQTKSGELDENIFIMPSAGGEPRQLTRHADCRCALPAWSPGGDSIAYACSDKTIRVVPFRGGEPRTVLTVEDSATGQARFDFRGGSLAWTPDGSRLLYADKGRVWTVPAAGGGPTAINSDVDGNIQQFALSPDGKTIAFNVLSGGDMELWMMEGFLPLVKSK